MSPSPIHRLLKPRHVAVVGASADPRKLTGRPVGYLRKSGFGGEIFPVNPRVADIGGLPCYPDVAALPTAPDVGLVLVGPEHAERAVADLAAKGAAAAIVLASGYGEADAEGVRRQQALKAAAGPMRLLGPNTIGLVNLTDRIVLSASGALELDTLPEGRISVVSQSGGILGAMLSRAADRGIGFAKLVSTGNEADLDMADFLHALAEDEATGVIALYMEGQRRTAAFRDAAQCAAARGKPVVVFKVGRSESGARAAVSHTGALAGAERMYDAFFRQLGIIRAETFADLIDIPAALAGRQRARGKRVAVLTSTGGAGTLIADCCGMAGLDVPVPDEETAARLAAIQGGDATAAGRNPVDVTLAGLKPELFRGMIGTLLGSAGYDALVVIVGSSALAQPNLVADEIAAAHAKTDKPLIAYVSPHAPHIVRMLNEKGVPALTAPESCAAVLAALGHTFPAAPAASPAPRVDGVPTAAGALDEAQSKALFAKFGIPGAREIAAGDAAAAAAAARTLGGRVAIKALSRSILHKSDVGGVKLGVAPEEAAAACAAIEAGLASHGAKAEGFLVQAMVAGGMEMILGLHRDPQLGLAILLGMGGVAAELLEESTVRLLPITRADAEAMVGALKTAPLLTGYRGARRRDVAALVDAILAFARMGEQLGERLIEAEINPLFVMPEGEGVVAADGLAVLG